MNTNAFFIVLLLIVLGVIALTIYFFVLVVKSAKQKGRSRFLWFFLSLLFSPFLCLLILMMVGETEAHRHARIIEEEKLRMNYRNNSN